MTIRFKIRTLLFLLTLVFAFTAITIHKTFNKADILVAEAKILESNLHQKEEFVKKFLNDPVNFRNLKTIARNEELGRLFIPEFADNRRVFLQTFVNHTVTFWNSIEVYFSNDRPLREGSSFISYNNGWYEAIKRSDGNFSVVCYIPIKSRYPYTNKYLSNSFSKDLINNSNLDIASLNDKDVYNIRSADGNYLFSVKLKSNLKETLTALLELWMWLFAALSFLIFVNYISVWIAEKGYVKLAAGVMFIVFSGLCYISSDYQGIHTYFNLEVFDPRYYSTQYFASLGNFLINALLSLWVAVFIYKYRQHIKFSARPLSKAAAVALFIILSVLVIFIGHQFDLIFSDLVIKSSINFDVTNVLSLDWLSWLGLLLFCLSALCFYLVAETALAIGLNLNITRRTGLAIFIIGLLIGVFNRIFFFEFNIFFLLFAGLIFLQAWRIFVNQGHYTAGYFILVIMTFALMASYKLSQFQNVKEKENRKELALELENADDPNAVLLFINLEKEILKDSVITEYFTSQQQSKSLLTKRLQKQYFDGYLSRYAFSVYVFNDNGKVLEDAPVISLGTYKNLVLTGSIKVSDYFYRINNTFGYQNYFALLPIKRDGRLLGTLVLELKSQQINDAPSAPAILTDGKIEENEDFKGYSYAFYRNGRLSNQYGKYVYNLANYDFAGKVRNFVFVTKESLNGEVYSHLIYQPNEYRLIVISKPVNNFTTRLAAISFVFIILAFFTCFILLLRELWLNFRSYGFGLSRYRIKYFVVMDRVLYKTRIQVSMVSTVVLTLLITGIITFYNISKQYRLQQNETILEKVRRISEGFDEQLFRKGYTDFNDQMATYFSSLAEVNTTDLNLYDIRGNLIYTTQPKLYSGQIVAPKMDAMAFLHLNRLQKTEHINEEKIGSLNFISAYAPLKNSRNEPVAYLGLPYLSNEQEFEQNIGNFLNALINIYTLVFVAIGFFAVFIANQITNPLSLVQKILSETNIGRKNEPIVWKRKDEIGNLIREYNNMIAALEESAEKLARSERESAWREMAKQIAHEIKNPLTPLKLGVQLLEKSWKEKDPDFDKKFEKFSKSFIEQIESLSHIASEFSNFAKMPDTVLTEVNLKQIIERSMEVYSQLQHIKIVFTDHTSTAIFVKGDKDQLLRSFNNLIKNSVEAIPEGREGIINIFLESKNSMADITIRDNGNGIPEHLEERIFTPNFTTKSSGTGLGLAFVKQAIENMGGSIRYETEIQKGTVFYLRIPLVRKILET